MPQHFSCYQPTAPFLGPSTGGPVATGTSNSQTCPPQSLCYPRPQMSPSFVAPINFLRRLCSRTKICHLECERWMQTWRENAVKFTFRILNHASVQECQRCIRVNKCWGSDSVDRVVRGNIDCCNRGSTSPANYLPYSLTAALSCLTLLYVGPHSSASLRYRIKRHVGVFLMTLQRKGNFQNMVYAFICPTHHMLYSKVPVIITK